MTITSILIPLISAIVGGCIAMIGSLLTSRIKAKADRRQELMTLAVQAGIEAFKTDRSSHLNTDIKNLPLSFYIYFHYNFLHLVEEGRATPQEIEKLNDRQKELLEVVSRGSWGIAITEPLLDQLDKSKGVDGRSEDKQPADRAQLPRGPKRRDPALT